jgi:hypothetical protein
MTFGSKWYFDPGLNAEGEEDEPPLTDPPTLPRAGVHLVCWAWASEGQRTKW